MRYDDFSISSGTSAPAPAQPPIAGNWTATFEENFDGTTLDGTKWKVGEYYANIAGIAGVCSRQIGVGNGFLTITAENRGVAYGGKSFNWATGVVSTSKRFRQAYGYMEARIAVDKKKGLWPAFWLMPDRGTYGAEDLNRMSYLRFNLAGQTNVTHAALHLRVSSAETGKAHNINIHPVEDSWSESTITWNNRPRENPRWLIHDYRTTAPSAGTDLVYDVTDYVQEKKAGSGLVSLVVTDSFNKSASISFGSRERAAASERPRLIVDDTTLYPEADAYVRAGSSYANVNYGGDTSLFSRESWGNATHTYGDGMEIDIAEILGIWPASQSSSAIHWDGYGADHKFISWPTYVPGGGSTSDFHVYGLYWAPGVLEFYIDGQLVAEYANSRVMSCPAYLILSLQMGGWDGNGNNIDPALYPAHMVVDYVKVWSGTKTPNTWTVDNTDSTGVTVVGDWGASSAISGYWGDDFLHDLNAGKGGKSVRYTPNLPYSGAYEVFGRWTSHSNRATNVPFDITHAGGTTTVTRNQRNQGGEWVSLGIYNFSAGTSGNVLIRTTGTDGYVIADAVRWVPASSGPVEIIKDNADPSGISIIGAWTESTAIGGYQGSNFLHDGNTSKGNKSVRLTPDIPVPGAYQVFGRWTSHSNRATNVPFDITHAGGTTTVTRNQRNQGGEWVSLGIYNFSAGTSGNVLIRTTGTDGYVIADAVRWVKQ